MCDSNGPIWYWAWTGPEGTRKLHKKIAQMHMDPTPATISSISKSTPLASWGVPYDQLAEEKKKMALFTDASAWYACITKGGW